MPDCRVMLATAPNPGAIAVLQLRGSGTAGIVREITGVREPMTVGRPRLASLAGIDDGVVVLLADDRAQLMPHGGPRVVQRLMDRLIEAGAVLDRHPDPMQVYPEAADPIEAAMLDALARAASPAAIDLLLAQPALWRDAVCSEAIAARSDVLDRLIDPPSVVVTGRPNVGKSTLTNRLLGRSASLVADLPGTTRDWVAGLAELVPPGGQPRDAVAVRWLDTPGLHDTADRIEAQAIALANDALRAADVLIAMRDPSTAWPADEALPREPDLWVVNKADTAELSAGDGRSAVSPLPISAQTGGGVDAMTAAVIERLALHDLRPEPWAFCAALRARVSG